ncbi:hypothetical protein BGX27_009593 [Mortierella sp. AM989]|nr:hypothetical protein BGX27_009593 [Mortierella sp. AM989]
MLAEKSARTQTSIPMLMNIPSFPSPTTGHNSPGPCPAKDSIHPAPAQQHNSGHPHHPSQPSQHSYQLQQQMQQQHLPSPSAVVPQAHPPQFSQSNHQPQPQPQPQQQQLHVHHPHQRVQAAHPRRGSTDKGTIKDPFKTKVLSTPRAISEYVGPYLLGKTLGKGSSGCVKLARHRKTNEQVAVKIISKATLVNRAAVHRGIEREIAIMKLINHPHVIRLYDVYETDKELFLVMEYVSGGELFEYLVNKGRLDEAEALKFFQQVIVGLAFCHKRKICHRDLKPENLLLDDQRNVKIVDFGMASLQNSERLLETSCGSPHYASPEVVTGMKYDGSSSDIWSCGIILYALLTGHLPFDDENIRQLLSKVKSGKFLMPSDISGSARDLISRMLTVNPKRRITMQGVMIHPWFKMANLEQNTLKEPAQDLERRCPMFVEELDAEIVQHMRWLFAQGPSHSDPEAKDVFDEETLLLDIQEKVTNDEENMEKLFYHLLCQHKAELLENYSGDESDIAPDAPRRRTDSFPNSAACSIRSATPEFGRSPLSPYDSPITSPGSPLSPVVKGMEPTPLSLNPEPTIVSSTHPGYMNELRRGQSPVNLNGAGSIMDTQSPYNVQGGSDQENKSKAAAEDSQENNLLKKDDSGRGDDVLKGESKAILSRKPTPVNGTMNENYNNHFATAKSGKADQSAIVHEPIAQLPPIRSIESINATNNSAGSATDDEIAIIPSIESQVLSTQISDINNNSTSALSTQVLALQQSIEGSTGLSSNFSSTEKLKSAVLGIRGQRPILHPLDVKSTAGTATTNISASKHSRKGSEGTSSFISTNLPSPRRPWFARLFDFKPQPLTFKSNVSMAEAQERVEIILKNLFKDSIQIENNRKAFGVKCRYEGGVIGDQLAKPVKFKVDISEKPGFLKTNTLSTLSRSNSSRTASSSAVATILAAANPNNSGVASSDSTKCNSTSSNVNAGIFKHGPSGSSSSSSSGSAIVRNASGLHLGKKKASEILAGRRASDGGSILSSAAAAVTSHFAKLSFHHHHSNHSSSSKHRHSMHGVVPNSGPQIRPGRIVKVTLHQQQGANSTLKMIFGRLYAAWDQPLEQQQSQPQPQLQLQLQPQPQQ